MNTWLRSYLVPKVKPVSHHMLMLHVGPIHTSESNVRTYCVSYRGQLKLPWLQCIKKKFIWLELDQCLGLFVFFFFFCPVFCFFFFET